MGMVIKSLINNGIVEDAWRNKNSEGKNENKDDK